MLEGNTKMPLSEQEQRLLEEMERSLYNNDSDFVATVGNRGGRPNYTLVVVGVLGLAAWSVTECTQGSDGAQVCTSSGGAPWVGWVVVALAVAYVVVLVRTTVRLTRAARRTAGTPVD